MLPVPNNPNGLCRRKHHERRRTKACQCCCCSPPFVVVSCVVVSSGVSVIKALVSTNQQREITNAGETSHEHNRDTESLALTLGGRAE